MTLQEQIKNIIFYYVKLHYNDYLRTNNLKFIEEEKIRNIISSLYNEEKKNLQEFIRQCLKEMMKDEYPSLIVENMIYQIFEDQELAINRVALEIKKYQQFIINNSSEEYSIKMPIDPDYGLGLKIDFFEDEVVVKNYKRNNENKILPAEKSGLISIGDSLIEINSISLENISTEERIEIVKKNLNTDFVTLKFRTYTNKNLDLGES